MGTEISAELAQRAREVHDRSFVIDTVNRSLMDERFLGDIMAGGISLLGRTILVSNRYVFSPFGFEESLRDITQTTAFVNNHPAQMMQVRTAADIRRAKEEGRVGVYIYFQSPEALSTQLWRVQLFYELGLRVLQLTYNSRALTGDGCSERTDCGLSDFGVAVIEECNRLGIVVDVSHCGCRTTMEAMGASRDPVLFTHANSRALVDIPRNKTDEQVKACAAQGGVIGVQVLPSALRKNPAGVTLDDAIDHIDHYVQLVGADHVGLGLDILTGHEKDDFGLLGYKESIYKGTWVNGVIQWPAGIESLADVPRITERLLARGYKDADVENILGGNFLRVFTQVWK